MGIYITPHGKSTQELHKYYIILEKV